MSVGLVMFWKAVVLGIAGAIWELWVSFKRRHVERGLPMRQEKDGVYRPYNWPEVWERRVRRSYWVGYAVFMIVGYSLVYVYWIKDQTLT